MERLICRILPVISCMIIYYTNMILNLIIVICPTYLQGNTGVPCWTLGSKCYCYSQLVSLRQVVHSCT